MGNCVQKLSEKIILIAAPQGWIEGKAIEQLENTAQLADIHQAAGMPDLHPGRGYPIGACFFSHHRIYPALIGNDVGCGMALFQTGLPHANVKLDKLEKQLHKLDAPSGADWTAKRETACQTWQLSASSHDHALGTIGGGNHFAEFLQADSILDTQSWLQLGLDQKRLLLLVHSGSRGLGQQILGEHIEQFGHRGLAADSDAGAAYLQAHNQALRWAACNRELIATRFLTAVRSPGMAIIDIPHNLLCPAQIAGQSGWLHRKGAAPSDRGPLIIPGSRGDFSYLVTPIARAESLYSVAHGTGRKWSRAECKERLRHRYTRSTLTRTAFGSRVLCSNSDLLYEEAPEAYKPSAEVIEALQQAGLISVIARLKPVLTYKTMEGKPQ